jgi:hypothetical protein
MRDRRTLYRWIVALGLTCGLLAAPGCRQWNWRGTGFGDRRKGWADKFRAGAPSDSTLGSGLDERAREIEHNLGVR